MLDSDAKIAEAAAAALRRERDDAILRAETAEAFLDEARARIEQLEQELADKPKGAEQDSQLERLRAEYERLSRDEPDRHLKMMRPPEFKYDDPFSEKPMRYERMIPLGPKMQSPRPDRFHRWVVKVDARQRLEYMDMQIQIQARLAGDDVEQSRSMAFNLDVQRPDHIGDELKARARHCAHQFERELGIRPVDEFASWIEAQTVLAIVMTLSK